MTGWTEPCIGGNQPVRSSREPRSTMDTCDA